MGERIKDPRQIVLNVCALFEQHRGMEAAELYFSPDYIEHNPEIPGGNLDGFKHVLVREGMDRPRGKEVKLSVLHVVAEGDDVGVHMLCEQPNSPPLMIMELYRVKDGLIVEHWDTMRLMPEEPLKPNVV